MQEDERRSLPPLVSSVNVSSFALGYLPEEIFAFDLPFTNYAWCHNAVEQGTSNNISITISMSEPVLLYGLFSGGYSSNGEIAYVTAFSITNSDTDNPMVLK